MNLFTKYFGKCFVAANATRKLMPTMGLNFFLAKNSTGNATFRHLIKSSKPVRTINKSRYFR